MADVSSVRFDDARHRAWLGDRELVRATTALADVGLIDVRWFTPASCARGQRIHAAAAQLFGGDAWLAGAMLEPSDLPYWTGLLRFRDDHEFACEQSEGMIVDEAEGYAGRFDLLGRFAHLPDGYLDLIDIKTGRAPAYVALQTRGYARRVLGRCRRWALELPGNGRHRLLRLNLSTRQTVDLTRDRQHEEVFLGAVRVSRFKRHL